MPAKKSDWKINKPALERARTPIRKRLAAGEYISKGPGRGFTASKKPLGQILTRGKTKKATKKK